ncbi:hypothetical protein B484DRAFT_425883 [Ochromonadaceae sp. CCMP2298]|nr:hypothetical protein B484DRAFT_425883 [Ochromonadaceae sp. CCMP2298]
MRPGGDATIACWHLHLALGISCAQGSSGPLTHARPQTTILPDEQTSGPPHPRPTACVSAFYPVDAKV